MSMTTFLSDALLNHVFRNSAYTAPTTVYVSLLTAVTDKEAGTVTEASYSGYARQSCAFAAPAAQYGGRRVQNSALISFGQKADAGSITGIAYGLHSLVTGGDLLFIAFIDQAAGAEPFEFVSLALASDTLQIPANGLASNQRVRLEAVPGGSTLPSPLAENTDYYVITDTADTIKLSASAGPGGAVDLTAAGKGLLYKVTPLTVNQNDTPQIPANGLTIVFD